MKVIHESLGRIVRADWQGGAYIELTFGDTDYRPTEVINVWDYRTDTTNVPFTRDGLRTELREWIKGQDIEWPEWYEDYLENARY